MFQSLLFITTSPKFEPNNKVSCRDNFRKLPEEARGTGKPPTELVCEKVEAMVYSGGG